MPDSGPTNIASNPGARVESTAGVPRKGGMFADYAHIAGVFDEMRTPDGGARPHFGMLLSELDSLGAEEMRRRRDACEQIIHEQGITYTVYGDEKGTERPWQLDPVPLIIAQQEWKGVEAALIQRATLINRILADCYGKQDLIRTAWLPPALVFAQPDFLRPVHGLTPPDDKFLHFYAADLARSPDGRWWVVSDRTQIPTGAGYALANRLVTSRIFPEAFRSCNVQRVAGFFREMRESLAALATRKTDNPRVVVLTPGAYNETYFEQTYLARYLGYTLVEGQDLTVRDDRVFLKTIGGLEPVDVILRRVDDDFCDPLELRNDSMLGVPGLVEAARAGNVAVANALGSGLLQSPAFKAFLPGLCRHVLGQELLMPSVATWWCGQKVAEEYVLSHLEKLTVKPAFRLQQRVDPQVLSNDELRARIRFQPHLWIAQEKVELSTAPSWDRSGLVAKRAVVRVYLVATPDGYKVMPGGLARTAACGDARLISMQHGGMSKDTWVLSDRPVEEVTLLGGGGRNVELRRTGNNLPSRLADDFCWLGRYAERLDATARLLRSTLIRFNPERGGGRMPHLLPFLQALERQGQLSLKQTDYARNAEALEAELLAMIFDPERPDSLRQISERVQRLAMAVRDRTSNDVWRVLSQFEECLAEPGNGRPMLAADAIPVLNRLLLLIASFYGLARENMTRAQGWRFIDIGQRIERSLYLCSLLDCSLRSPEADDPSVLEAVLEYADSTLTYRSRYTLVPNIAAVYDLVLLDGTNPRSLLFQLLQLEKHFDRLPQESRTALPSPGQRVLIGTVARVRLLDPRELFHSKGPWHDGETGRVIREVEASLPRLSDAIAVNYFAHSAISRAGN
jgi:uncharacterized circularly permuted ATP-grasp superfamily protein/uncharacterized alpha-E superfamily protein